MRTHLRHGRAGCRARPWRWLCRMLANDAGAPVPNADQGRDARLALLPPLVGARKGVRRHKPCTGVALEGFLVRHVFSGRETPVPAMLRMNAVWNGTCLAVFQVRRTVRLFSFAVPNVYAPAWWQRCPRHAEGRMVKRRHVSRRRGRASLPVTTRARASDAFLDDPIASSPGGTGLAPRAGSGWRDCNVGQSRLFTGCGSRLRKKPYVARLISRECCRGAYRRHVSWPSSISNSLDLAALLLFAGSATT